MTNDIVNYVHAVVYIHYVHVCTTVGVHVMNVEHI